jgi:putative chitinase
MELTTNQISAMMPGIKNIEEWTDAINKMLPKYEINTQNRIAGFISQTGHESNNYKIIEENLNYSATRLDVIFAKYFRRAGRDATEYHGKPSRIANVVYANRMGNGDASSNDGFTFRGRGIIQLTGRNNYTSFANSIDITVEEAVDYTCTKEGAIASACWFWQKNKLNDYCDASDVKGLTKRINGGHHGLKDRENRWRKVLAVFDGDMEAALSTAKIGSSGLAVRLIQKALGINVDGDFGHGTHRALKDWQRRSGLVPDGIAGPSTYQQLLG